MDGMLLRRIDDLVPVHLHIDPRTPLEGMIQEVPHETGADEVSPGSVTNHGMPFLAMRIFWSSQQVQMLLSHK